MIEIVELENNIKSLLQQVGDQRKISSIKQFKRIGNNRTFIIDVCGTKYFLKQFFQDKNDQRDRFYAECSFIRYAEKVAPGCTPRMLSVDSIQNLILYEFIEGKPIQKAEVSQKEITQAAFFFRKLNQDRNNATSLPIASEACFSISDHISLINNRICQLELIPADSDENILALQTIKSIRISWNKLIKEVYSRCFDSNISPEKELDDKFRVISPSDFGFHNALMKEDGHIIFLDFEYSGWDDPAKMVGDFFGQIQVPVSNEYLTDFINLSLSGLPGEEQHIKRTEILSPAFQIKWACIAMNVFLPINLARRKFAYPDLDEKELKQLQMIKANTILKNFQTHIDGIY